MMKMIGFILGLAVLVSCGSSDPDTPAPPEYLPGRALKVMTYNIVQTFHNRGETDPHNWNKGRKERVVRLLETYPCDLLCMQEDDKKQGEDVCEALGLTRAGVSRSDGTVNGGGEFCALYYDPEVFFVRRTGHFYFSETPMVPSMSWDATYTTMCNWFCLKDKKSNADIYLFNTHLFYGGTGETRMKSVAMLEKYIASIAGGNPVILTGDMNATPENEAIAAIRGFLSDAWDKASLRKGPAGSFNGFNPNYDLDKYKFDYIFVNNRFEVGSHTIIPDKVDGYFPSDHLPVLCEMTLK